MQLEKTVHRCCPAPSLELTQPKSTEPLPSCSQLHSMLSSGLVQMIGQVGPNGQWHKEPVIDPRGRPLQP
jgi:hypothetical protein